MRAFVQFSLLLLSISLFFSCGTDVNDNDLDPDDDLLEFELSTNGITIKCPDASVGDMGLVDGVKYEAVDNDLLRQRIEEGSDLTKVCVSLLTDMNELFYNSRDFNQPIGNWDVSNVTNMSGLFFNSQAFNRPIGKWDVSNVTDMSRMFFGYSTREYLFNQPIGEWDVSSVTDMSEMFHGSSFNQPIGDWDVSSVTDMSWMFDSSQFNQPIGEWVVNSVTDISAMFMNTRFNYNISGWCVSKIETEPDNFSFNSPLIEQNKPKWGTCPD